jgi:large-conductance mechanosensitive channel
MSGIIQPFDQVYKNFVDFAWKNNILASTAGFTIGLATKDFIDKVMKHLGFGNGIMKLQEWLYTLLRVSPSPSWTSAVLLIIGDFLIWIAVIVITFVIATYIMAYLIPDKERAEQKESDSNAN